MTNLSERVMRQRGKRAAYRPAVVVGRYGHVLNEKPAVIVTPYGHALLAREASNGDL